MINKRIIRIGNIIGRFYMNPAPTGLKKCIEACEIQSLGVERIIVNSKIGSKELIKMGYENVRPVEIDDFWIKQLGFKKEGEFYYKKEVIVRFLEHEAMFCIEDVLADSNPPNYITSFNYVHELQNLFFDLTDCELAIA